MTYLTETTNAQRQATRRHYAQAPQAPQQVVTASLQRAFELANELSAKLVKKQQATRYIV